MPSYVSLRGLIFRPWQSFIILLSFTLNTLGPIGSQAQEFILPAPGQMVALSPAYSPVVLKGIKLDPQNPFRFHFYVDTGDSFKRNMSSPNALVGDPQQEQLKEESSKLIKYFLASLTIPEKDLWVNLSPYEKDRIVPKEFGQTEMGRDLLAEDYLLKQITASLIYPESKLGKEFWNKVYAQAQAKYGTTNIPINTFNKVWIVPDKAVVYENNGTAFVLENHLKVMLEEDYLSLQKHMNINNNVIPAKAGIQNKTNLKMDPRFRGDDNVVNNLGSQIIRELVIPALTKEVNSGKNFAPLRQVFYSLILATWYKKKIKESILNKIYSDRNKIQGTQTPNDDVQFIYQQYLKAFKKGVFNYINDSTSSFPPLNGEGQGGVMVPRKYFSGGVEGSVMPELIDIKKPGQVSPAMLGDFAQTAHLTDVSAVIGITSNSSNQQINQAMTNEVEIEQLKIKLNTLFAPDIAKANQTEINPQGYLLGITKLFDQTGLDYGRWPYHGVLFPDGVLKSKDQTGLGDELRLVAIKWQKRDDQGRVVRIGVSGENQAGEKVGPVIYVRWVDEKGQVDWIKEKEALERRLEELYKPDLTKANQREEAKEGYLFEMTKFFSAVKLRRGYWPGDALFPKGVRKANLSTFLGANLESIGIKWLERDKKGEVIKIGIAGLNTSGAFLGPVEYLPSVVEGQMDWVATETIKVREKSDLDKKLELFFAQDMNKLNQTEINPNGYLEDITPALGVSKNRWPDRGVIFPDGVIMRRHSIGFNIVVNLVGVKWQERDGQGRVVRIGIAGADETGKVLGVVIYERWVDKEGHVDWIKEDEAFERRLEELYKPDITKANQTEINPKGYLQDLTTLFPRGGLDYDRWPSSGVLFPDKVRIGEAPSGKTISLNLALDLRSVGIKWQERNSQGRVVRIGISGEKKTGEKVGPVIYVRWIDDNGTVDWVIEKEARERRLEELYKLDINKANQKEEKDDGYLYDLTPFIPKTSLYEGSWPLSGVLFPQHVRIKDKKFGFRAIDLESVGIKWQERDSQGNVIRVAISGKKRTGEKVGPVIYVQWIDKDGKTDWIRENEAVERRLEELYKPDLTKINQKEINPKGYLVDTTPLFSAPELLASRWPGEGILFPNQITTGLIQRNIGVWAQDLKSVGVKWQERDDQGRVVRVGISARTQSGEETGTAIYVPWDVKGKIVDWIKASDAIERKLQELYKPNLQYANQRQQNKQGYLQDLTLLFPDTNLRNGTWTTRGVLFPDKLRLKRFPIGLGRLMKFIGIQWVDRDNEGKVIRMGIMGQKVAGEIKGPVVYERKVSTDGSIAWVKFGTEQEENEPIGTANVIGEGGVSQRVMTPLENLRLKIGRAIQASLQGRYEESQALWDDIAEEYAKNMHKMAMHTIDIGIWKKIASLIQRKKIEGRFQRWAFAPSGSGLELETMLVVKKELAQAGINFDELKAWHIDMSARMNALSKSTLQGSNIPVEYIEGKNLVNDSWPMEDGSLNDSLDGVVASELWTFANKANEHGINGRAWYLWQANRVLRKGGVLIVSAPHIHPSERMLETFNQLGFALANPGEEKISFDFSRIEGSHYKQEIAKIKDQVSTASVLILVKQRDITIEEVRNLKPEDLEFDYEIDASNEDEVDALIERQVGQGVDLSKFPWDDLLLNQNKTFSSEIKVSSLIDSRQTAINLLDVKELDRDVYSLLMQLFGVQKGKIKEYRIEDIPQRLTGVKEVNPHELEELRAKVNEILGKIPKEQPSLWSDINWGRVKNYFSKIEQLKKILNAAMNTANSGALNESKGGIDLNPAQNILQIKTGISAVSGSPIKTFGDDKGMRALGDDKGMRALGDDNSINIDAAQITGVTFSIDSMEQVKDLPAILGLKI